ncbi:MAG: amidohydrolase family protein, partial [Planctomycetota bacterium]
MDERLSRVESVVVEHGKIAAVGATRELESQFPHARTWNLQGRSLIPGFVDAHHHFMVSVLYGNCADCRPESCRTLQGIQQRLWAHGQTLKREDWIIGAGYNQWALTGQRHPNRHDLDAVSTEQPVLLVHFSFHAGVANTKALQLLGADRLQEDPPGGKLERDRSGYPTGRLFEAAFAPMEAAARKNLTARLGPEVLAEIQAYEQDLFRLGITLVNDPAVPRSIQELYELAQEAGKLRMPVVMLPVSDSGFFIQPWDKVEQSPPGCGGGNLQVGPLKLFFDGGDHCAMCLSLAQGLRMLWQSYNGFKERKWSLRSVLRQTRLRWHWDGKIHTGILYYTRDQAPSIVAKAVARGYSVAIHAFGNEAVAQALDAIIPIRDRHGDHPPP